MAPKCCLTIEIDDGHQAESISVFRLQNGHIGDPKRDKKSYLVTSNGYSVSQFFRVAGMVPMTVKEKLVEMAGIVHIHFVRTPPVEFH